MFSYERPSARALTGMDYRRVGASGLMVSEVGLGTWRTFGGSLNSGEARRLVHRALELGITLFDTADRYHLGEAERSLGGALADVARDEYVLATKLGLAVGERPTQGGLSRKHVIEGCDASLKRLGVDHVDLLQCHRPDAETPLDETLQALDDLVAAGKVLYTGVSEFSASQLRECRAVEERRGLRPLISNQPAYSLLARSIEGEVLPTSRQLGLGTIAFSPLAQGVLTGKYRSGADAPAGARASRTEDRGFVERFLDERVLDAVQGFVTLARDAGWDPAQLALAWVLSRRGVSAVLIGATRREHIELAARRSQTSPDPALLDAAADILAPARSFIRPSATRQKAE